MKDNGTGMIKVKIKPLSVNDAWQGRRYKTEAYKSYECALMLLLPKTIKMPKPPYELYLKFGFSSSASDWDNPIKTTQDIIAKKYKFNDKQIKRAVVDTEIVKKGEEYIQFNITTLEL